MSGLHEHYDPASPIDTQDIKAAAREAQRLYDDVRRQQVRTQMVINNALMLCSPAFGRTAETIKSACALLRNKEHLLQSTACINN